MNENEVIQVHLLPRWLKSGNKVKITKGKYNENYGFIKDIVSPCILTKHEYLVKVNMPNVGEDFFEVNQLKAYNRDE